MEVRYMCSVLCKPLKAMGLVLRCYRQKPQALATPSMRKCSLLRLATLGVQTCDGESAMMQLVAMHEAPGRLRASSVLVLTSDAVSIHKNGWHFLLQNHFFCQTPLIISLLENRCNLFHTLLFAMASSGRNTRASTRNDGRFSLQMRSRRSNEKAIIDNPLAHMTDEELQRDVRSFVENHIPSIAYEDLIRAARVAKDVRLYDDVARKEGYHAESDLLVQLTEEEKRALRRERDVPFSEKGMRAVILTVSIAALLQGFVQSSFNGAGLYREEWGLQEHVRIGSTVNWEFGAVNAIPFFVAAVIGCPLALPINYWFGRRGGICAAAVLIFASSIAAAFSLSWYSLLGVRVFNGIGRQYANLGRRDCCWILARICHPFVAAMGRIWHHDWLRIQPPLHKSSNGPNNTGSYQCRAHGAQPGTPDYRHILLPRISPIPSNKRPQL